MARLRAPVSQTDHARGDVDAPVTLVAYGDYECSLCGQAYPIVKQLQKQLGKRLHFVFRNFPLENAHPHAMHAALAAETVGALGGEGPFWVMHDALYERQNALDDAALGRYANDAGVDGASVSRRSRATSTRTGCRATSRAARGAA